MLRGAVLGVQIAHSQEGVEHLKPQSAVLL